MLSCMQAQSREMEQGPIVGGALQLRAHFFMTCHLKNHVFEVQSAHV